jgi:GT2 family glycosyltransferase
VRDPQAYRFPRSVEWASGAIWALSPECDRTVGPWDEGFFLYSEESEYADRVRAAEFEIRYVPTAVAVHEGGASGRSPELAALEAVNRVRHYGRTHGTASTHLFRGTLLLASLLRSRSSEQRQVARSLVRPSRWHTLPTASRALGRTAEPAHQSRS